MSVADAKDYGLENGQMVKVFTPWDRAVTFENVVVRADDAYALDMHIDTDEANAAWLGAGAWGEIIS